MSEQPFFRFYPKAYADGVFEPSSEMCDVCDRKAVWLYTGNIYTENEPPNVCARCIADGSLGRKLKPDAFVLQDVVLEGADPALADEILQATPGVACINPFDWPVIEGKPLAFVGQGDDAALKNDPAIRAAICEAFDGEDAHGSHALVFKQIDGDAIVAVPDLD